MKNPRHMFCRKFIHGCQATRLTVVSFYYDIMTIVSRRHLYFGHSQFVLKTLVNQFSFTTRRVLN